MGSSDGQKSAACRGSADLSGYGRADMQAVTGVYRGRWVLSSGGRDRTDNKKGSTSNEVRGVRKSFNHKRLATGLRFSRSFQPPGIRNTIALRKARLLPLGRARLPPSRTSVLSNQCSVIAKSTPISGARGSRRAVRSSSAKARLPHLGGRGSRRAERHHQSQTGPSCPRSTQGGRIVTTFFGSAGASPSQRGEATDEPRVVTCCRAHDFALIEKKPLVSELETGASEIRTGGRSESFCRNGSFGSTFGHICRRDGLSRRSTQIFWNVAVGSATRQADAAECQQAQCQTHGIPQFRTGLLETGNHL
ncbi:MAG: hypothetical protein RIT02_113, partial [Planctomycetota bacterium]